MLNPINCLWKDGKFVPATSYQLERCQGEFKDGSRYALIEFEARSPRSHNHFFAALHEAFDNLPEDISDEFPTFDKFRATALISTGFYNERQIVCESPEQARQFAAFIRPIDDLAIIAVHDCAVVERKAKSQSVQAMGKKEFQASKDAVLGWAWGLVGVDPAVGNANAGQAA